MLDPEQERRLNKMYIDLYEGVDSKNPSITARLLLLEDDVNVLKEMFEKLNANLGWGVKLLLGSLLLAICNLVFNAVKH